jgi:hypothetical protein
VQRQLAGANGCGTHGHECREARRQFRGGVKIPKYVAADNARRFVSTTGCVQVGSRGWRLSGTATNASSSSRAYSIVVDFVTVTGDTVLDTKLLNVGPVAPKSAVGWSVTGAAGQHHVTCVIRQAMAK